MRSLLIIGASRADEIRELDSSILTDLSGWSLMHCRSIDEAVLRRMSDPDIVLVLQTRPMECSSAGVQRLYDAYPMARLIVGFGVWCGSASRREGVWPESVATPLWNVAARLRQEITEMESGVAALPLTAGREERMSRAAASMVLPTGMRVLIKGLDRPLREWIADLISEAGGLPRFNAGDANGVVWDVGPWNGKARLNDRPIGPVVALAGLPTTSASRRLRAAGATAVLGKPCDGQDLLRALGGEA